MDAVFGRPLEPTRPGPAICQTGLCNAQMGHPIYECFGETECLRETECFGIICLGTVLGVRQSMTVHDVSVAREFSYHESMTGHDVFLLQENHAQFQYVIHNVLKAVDTW